MHAFKLEITPARTIAAGFALVIILGAVLLRLPFCLRPGVTLSFIDSLYTATSAVCVTGIGGYRYRFYFFTDGRGVNCPAYPDWRTGGCCCGDRGYGRL